MSHARHAGVWHHSSTADHSHERGDCFYCALGWAGSQETQLHESLERIITEFLYKSRAMIEHLLWSRHALIGVGSRHEGIASVFRELRVQWVRRMLKKYEHNKTSYSCYEGKEVDPWD